MDISNSVTSLSGVGPAVAAKLAKLDIHTLFDLLYHLPFRYEDRSQIRHISTLQPGETVTVIGKLETLKNQFTGGGRLIQKGVLTDASGSLDIVWFNQSFLTRVLKPGSQVAMYGKIEFYGRTRALIAPEYELLPGSEFQISKLTHMGCIVSVYPETAGLTSKWFRTALKKLLPNLSTALPDFLPNQLSWLTALQKIHFPSSLNDIEPAKNRLASDEILLLQLAGLTRKSVWQKNRLTRAFELFPKELSAFQSSLPFSLTSTQLSAISAISSDLSRSTSMNRLLEGDVGTGKTVVAAVAAYLAHLNGLHTIFLAPTQILAAQHHQTLTKLFAPYSIKIGLVTSQSRWQKQTADLSIVVGTHALLNHRLDLQKIGLVVIDEQHRFGVLQRSLANIRGQSPHVLTMTATPIPRTMALIIHGDLDITYLDQSPPGRLPIKTWVVPENKRDSAYSWIKSQINKNHTQVFVVCPYIEPSETIVSVKAVTVEFSRLQKIFIDQKLGLLHGKLTPSLRNTVMSKFSSGEIDILVTTPVVEVGVDIQNASVMLIEDAERFGLAQLHQLRGRVGRSSAQAYCLLFSNSTDSSRLKFLETNSSGHQLAELDFRLRGPGHLYGTAQHGQIQFKIASYANLELINTVRNLAETIFPHLANYPVLLKLIENDKISLIQPN